MRTHGPSVKTGTETGSSPSASLFFCQDHSAIAARSFNQLHPTPCLPNPSLATHLVLATHWQCPHGHYKVLGLFLHNGTLESWSSFENSRDFYKHFRCVVGSIHMISYSVISNFLTWSIDKKQVKFCTKYTYIFKILLMCAEFHFACMQNKVCQSCPHDVKGCFWGGGGGFYTL